MLHFNRFYLILYYSFYTCQYPIRQYVEVCGTDHGLTFTIIVGRAVQENGDIKANVKPPC